MILILAALFGFISFLGFRTLRRALAKRQSDFVGSSFGIFLGGALGILGGVACLVCLGFLAH